MPRTPHHTEDRPSRLQNKRARACGCGEGCHSLPTHHYQHHRHLGDTAGTARQVCVCVWRDGRHVRGRAILDLEGAELSAWLRAFPEQPSVPPAMLLAEHSEQPRVHVAILEAVELADGVPDTD